MVVAAFFVCGLVAFFTHRAEHGRTSSERSAYALGANASEQTAAAGGILPTDAALHMIAQENFAKQGSGEPMAWKSAFANGYASGFKKK